MNRDPNYLVELVSVVYMIRTSYMPTPEMTKDNPSGCQYPNAIDAR